MSVRTSPFETRHVVVFVFLSVSLVFNKTLSLKITVKVYGHTKNSLHPSVSCLLRVFVSTAVVLWCSICPLLLHQNSQTQWISGRLRFEPLGVFFLSRKHRNTDWILHNTIAFKSESFRCDCDSINVMRRQAAPDINQMNEWWAYFCPLGGMIQNIDFRNLAGSC